MHLLRRFLSSALAASLVTMPLYAAPKPPDNGVSVTGNQIRHVLLISVDGLHALDVANYVAAHPTSALAELSGHGITYSNARTPTNSDSFPGLLALITGGSQVSHGLFYDVSYNRGIFAPTDPTCSNPAGHRKHDGVRRVHRCLRQRRLTKQNRSDAASRTTS